MPLVDIRQYHCSSLEFPQIQVYVLPRAIYFVLPVQSQGTVRDKEFKLFFIIFMQPTVKWAGNCHYVIYTFSSPYHKMLVCEPWEGVENWGS